MIAKIYHLIKQIVENMMKIEEIQIKGLFGKKDICWKLNPQVNVLVGVNGSGKSTILSILYDILSIQTKEKNITLFDTAKVCFIDNTITEYLPTEKIIEHNITKNQENFNPASLLPLLFFGKNPILSVATTVVLVAASTSSHQTQETVQEKIISKAIQGKNLKENLYLDLIEANLTNSNANHIINKNNQEQTNALDMEIRETIYEFNKIKKEEWVKRLENSLNLFFNQIGKQVRYEDDELIYLDKTTQKQLNYSYLSSGERQLIYILLRVALSNADKNKTAIILMDEPEISLHLDWQEHFIKQLTILNPDAQFIIVTHSPALIMDGWNDVYTDMEEITTWL